ncbi:MAG: hypothetical protein H8E41_11235 [Desulfobulbaceae bacterium]|uniref:Uncharacterized protein n=1 Tax=Candidatus Desulfobia pelagia TaxID=2841692 RepID=A0A8J6TGV1_9BACT|nr:hypothetical protein [Candidatus Desulfobia pelagia]
MAEIRSTMDMVLERAARMEAEAANTHNNDETLQAGMKTAASYMRDEDVDLVKDLNSYQDKDKACVLKGLIQIFLRNIMLPREDDDQAGANRAMQGLVELGQGSGDLLSIFSDMKSILDRYSEHKKQLKQQLEEQFSQQMNMMEQDLAKKTGVSMKLEPSQHPKFAEEWLKLRGQLNEQYGQALDQYKQHIEQQLTAMP